MAQMCRLRVDLSGTAVVGQSVLTIYTKTAGSGLPAAVLSWLNALKANFPTGLTFTVPNGGDLIEATTGELAGSWTDTGGGTVSGTAAGTYTLGSGFRVKWTTDGVVAGRRVRGTTFFVPCTALCFDTTGRLGSATVSAISSATSTYLAAVSPNLVVWSRPIVGRPGTYSEVNGFTVPALPTQLRSRRV